jgi:hypothetical protein
MGTGALFEEEELIDELSDVEDLVSEYDELAEEDLEAVASAPAEVAHV